MPKKFVLLKIPKKKKKIDICAKMVENSITNFSVGPYCTLLFSRKESLNFVDIALAVVLCNDVIGSIMNV